MNIYIILYLLFTQLSYGRECEHSILKKLLKSLYPIAKQLQSEQDYTTNYPISPNIISPEKPTISHITYQYNLYFPVFYNYEAPRDSFGPNSFNHGPSHKRFHPAPSSRTIGRKIVPNVLPSASPTYTTSTTSVPTTSSRKPHTKSFPPKLSTYKKRGHGLHRPTTRRPKIQRDLDQPTTSPSIPSSTVPSSTVPSSTSSTVSDRYDPSTHPNWKLVNDEKCGSNSENRIVGGINASLGQYPWIARIGYSIDENQNNITFKCGGTLITRNHVITAAHCIIDLPDNFQVAQVRLGEYDTSKQIDCVDELCATPHLDFDIHHVLVHINYGEPKNANDIAIIKLNTSVTFTGWITPICLPFGSLLTKELIGNKVDIAGWGYYDVTIPKGSIILQTVKLPVLPISTCTKKFRRYVINEKKQICVGGEVGKDSCNGDSGGPLMKVEVEGGEGPKFYLYGVVSFGATYCGMTTSPAVYTKVTNYVKWILDNLYL